MDDKTVKLQNGIVGIGDIVFYMPTRSLGTIEWLNAKRNQIKLEGNVIIMNTAFFRKLPVENIDELIAPDII